MSSNGFKPAQTNCRPWSQTNLDADDSTSHGSPQHSDALDPVADDDTVSMTYAEYSASMDFADDAYDEEGQPEDDYNQPDDWFQPHGLYQQIPHQTTAAAQPDGTHLPDDPDVADGDGGTVAPVNYLSIASILTDDVDMEGYTPDYHQYPPHVGVQGVLYGAHEAAIQWDDPGDVPAPHAEPVASQNAEEVQQQLDELGPGDEFEDGSTVWFPVPAPPAFVSPNMSNLHPANYGLAEFLQHWSFTGARKSKGQGRFPWPQKVADFSRTHLTHVQYADLAVDECDFQGINWEDLQVTRRGARERRRLTYKNYTNQEGSDISESPLQMGAKDSFFRFRRMDIRRNTHLSHFQLRNVLASPSRTQMFYTGSGVVHRFNPVSGNVKTVIRLPEAPHTQISTLAADHGILAAGGFNGEYMLRPIHLDSEDESSRSCDGLLTSHQSGITNHAQIYLSRQSLSPRAAFASNDQVVRVLDIETKSHLSEEAFSFPINCSAISPDRRLRVMVGDSNRVLITTAESTLGSGRPEILQQLVGHRDFGFACDWADDGWTVATGFQDRLVNIWDARRWTDSSGRAAPVESIRTEMAGVRSLHFSPIGSGKRVLVATEEADFVNIIDAQTFRSKQTVDIFGEIGGTSFTNDGQDLVVLCTDRARGGLIQFERCGLGAEASWIPDENPCSLPSRELVRQRGRTFDWPRNYHNDWKLAGQSETRRRRKAASVDALEPF